MAKTNDIEITELIEPQPSEYERLEHLLQTTGWSDNQIRGQLQLIKMISQNKQGIVFVANNEGNYVGFASAQHYDWNKLSQIHGLVVDKDFRRHKIASDMVVAIEKFMREKASRGLYVDTPITNDSAREFYENLGFKKDYVMTKYYDDNTDGVTYVKFF